MDQLNVSFEIDSDESITDLLNSTAESIHKLNVDTETLQENLISATDQFIDKIIIYYLRHLSLVGLEDLMELLNEQRKSFDRLPTHKKQILQMFRENREMIDVIYFIRCSKCDKIIEKNSENMERAVCCDTILKKTETNFFVYMPLEKQIVQSINRNWEAIKNFDTSNRDNDNISDAHDGDILKEVLQKYDDDDLNILSLCVNVDGANRFNSNSVSLWPIQFIQNYLPPEIRFLPHNVLVSGLLSTEGHFDFREYFLPIVRELERLEQEKIVMTIENVVYTFQPVVTHCAVDLPAKAKIQETKQFGGYNACSYCHIPGVQVSISCKTKNKKRKIKYGQENVQSKKVLQIRYPEGTDSFALRDEKDTLQKMIAASKCTNNAVDGIKDVSCLAALQHFNIVRSIGIDYLHGVLIGTEKQLINFFCDPSNSQSSYYITKKKRELLNKRILSIKPIREVNRKPRSLDMRSKFKASEYRSMLLYYLPVCLQGCLPDVYLQHFRILSAAIYILMKSEVPRKAIDETEIKLHRFVKQHQQLFGVESMVMNVHLLKHLAQDVRWLGPLWCHSTFPFERNNGVLLKKVNGTTDVLLQISSKYCLAKSIKQTARSKPKTNKKVLLGKSVKLVDPSLRVFNIESLKEIDLSNIELYVHKRINLNDTIFTSTSYTLPKRSVDYFVEATNDIVGKVRFYFESNSKVYAVIEEFEVIDNIAHILKVQPTNRNILVSVNQIEQKFIYMKVGFHEYIVLPPNPYEKE
ncbi:uncharacterized protein LOC119083916 [Bradysia coprophila]|uniref:uncharacterized protein LOC119083916 n=1 Tax=Bradysia coprophila TaxID=38358 RepID=UPI00187DAA32|nr:uncharacterized protein LOC119083916 [Bradysia coprophila]